MRFDWDETKNTRNHRKHGVWFEEAQTIWADPRATEFFDPDHLEDEDRFLRVGYSTKDRLLLVVFCERCDGDVCA
ncbi:MAG: BrnT family toxin [Hyphomicrobiaceae bacterium]|nr:BrnT family toxin [Hyphomicrobiaceae bacterium]